MHKLRYGMIAISLLLCSITSAKADVNIGIGLPNVSIGINLPLYPELVRVPGYPVYYAPRMDANYFFYDGMYWVYENDNWYASSWYNGPWSIVGSEIVPLYVLRIPVRYYRQPPVYFRGWQANAPPRWGQHWGPGWEQHRRGWNNWNRSSAPRPAPLPVYQKQYSGDRYPHVEQQRVVHNQQYRYQPKDKVVRQHLKQEQQKAPVNVQPDRKPQPAVNKPKQPDTQHTPQRQIGAPPGPNSHPPQRGGEQVKTIAPKQQPAQQQPARPQEVRKQPAPVVHEQKKPEPVKHEQKQPTAPVRVEQKHQPAPAAKDQPQHQNQPKPQPQQEQQAPRQQDRGEAPGGGHGQGQRNDDDRGQGRNK